MECHVLICHRNQLRDMNIIKSTWGLYYNTFATDHVGSQLSLMLMGEIGSEMKCRGGYIKCDDVGGGE